MKRTLYLLALSSLIWILNSDAFAQSNLGPRKSEIQEIHGSGSVISESGSMTNRPSPNSQFNTRVPLYDQINTPIRWYALENENNDFYWDAVNPSKIWVEIELDRSIYDDDIQDFLLANGLVNIIHESRFKELTNYWIFENLNTSSDAIVEMAKGAQEIDGIKFLEPSVIYTKSYTPNDPLWDQQWGPYVTYFDEAWDYGTGGNSLNVVAVMDNACDWNHEDLYDQVWYGYDYVYGSFDIAPVQNSHLHGTHVTGTVAATIGNGIGVAGMVNDTVYFAKVGDDQDALVDQAIVDGLYDISTIDRISVLNMSLGGDVPSAAIEQACNTVWNSGKLIIAASGNNGQGFIGFPAAFPSCVAIGSIGADGNSLYLTGYSQYGDEQELSAPGGDVQTGFGIMSCVPGNDYDAIEGTSMAAPHVTGLAGLMKNLNPDLTNVDIRNILAATAFDYGDSGWDQYFGFGMINALGAVEAAVGVATSTVELNKEAVFDLYPNPAQDRLFIDMKMDLKNISIEIIDITGKLVSRISYLGQEKIQMDLSDLKSGVYIIRLQSNKGVVSSKFIKS